MMTMKTADEILEEMTGAIEDGDMSTIGEILNTLIQGGQLEELVTVLEAFYIDPVAALPGIGRLPEVETTDPLEEYLQGYETMWTAKNAQLFI